MVIIPQKFLTLQPKLLLQFWPGCNSSKLLPFQPIGAHSHKEIWSRSSFFKNSSFLHFSTLTSLCPPPPKNKLPHHPYIILPLIDKIIRTLTSNWEYFTRTFQPGSCKNEHHNFAVQFISLKIVCRHILNPALRVRKVWRKRKTEPSKNLFSQKSIRWVQPVWNKEHVIWEEANNSSSIRKIICKPYPINFFQWDSKWSGQIKRTRS